jgi:hypothetical protein
MNVHVTSCAYLVPGLLTSGSATHCSEAAQGVSWNLPPTHCANWPLTHADSPDVHGDDAVRLWNFTFSACASFPFCSVNAARRSIGAGPAVTAVATKVRENTSWERCMAGSLVDLILIDRLWCWGMGMQMKGKGSCNNQGRIRKERD